MSRTVLLEPMAVIGGRRTMFLRDAFGGEVPLSCPYPPLELASTAALLQRFDLPVELIAANVHGLSHEAVASRLVRRPPERVLVPSAWGSLDDDLSLLRLLRRALPRTELILSGPNVTAEPERAAGIAHLVIRGEPEEAMLRLARGHARSDIPNLAWWSDGELVTTDRALPAEYENYPVPARELLDLRRYRVPFSRRLPSTTIASSRGCTHTCSFCPSQLWYRRQVRYRRLDRMAEELTDLVGRYRMRELVFRDETFTQDPERVEAMCELLGRYPLTWRCFATVDTVSPSMLRSMASAGCVQVCYGFESGDDGILAKTGKRTLVEQGFDAARWTREAKMEIAGTFVVGLEGENERTLQRSIDMALDLNLDYVQVNAATPLPGTGFGRRHQRRGAPRPGRFRWSGGDAERDVRRFYRQVYLRPGYVMGRLRSRRGLRSLWQHALLGWRMALYLAERP